MERQLKYIVFIDMDLDGIKAILRRVVPAKDSNATNFTFFGRGYDILKQFIW